MTSGTVTKIVPRDDDTARGGFGFIRDEQGEDRFFHARDVRGTTFEELLVDDRVQFDAVASTKGLRATNVYVVRERDGK